MNRLAGETSPYLRQHAGNPVDWHPWDEEAFAEARRRDVPILLSVGYSSCHWCHVMAHESFEDEATARLMNELFVNVKVDREERPDVDAIYMEVVQAMTGHGGWPMTVWMTPDGRPFFGGTYFPVERRGPTPGFAEVCRAVDHQWRTNRAALADQAGELTAGLGRLAQLDASADLSTPADLDEAAERLLVLHDARWGGFGPAPKFPHAMSLDFLLQRGRRVELEAAVTTLDAMAAGGIYDHLGGGFARYSVDARWLVPHFEKMLYDNALLVRAYLHAWQRTGRADHRQIVEETIGYVLRDLRQPGGGFASAEDADSEGEEGRFYVWSHEEVARIGGPACVEWYGVTEAGNFEGRNILFRPVRGDLVRPPEVEAGRAALFEARAQRVRPGLDDKVLTEWNGLMLAALAEAGAAMGRADWLEAAVANADFLVDELRRPGDGRWLRSWQGGRARHLGYAADYAAVVDAFTRLSEATGQARWLEVARRTADEAIALFWDGERGGFHTTGHDAEPLITRPKDLQDNAVPAASSLAATALLRLAALTGGDRYRSTAEASLRLVTGLVARHPTAFGQFLCALDLRAAPMTEIVVAGDRPDLVEVVQRRYLPHAVLAWGERYDTPLWEDRPDGAAYVCRGFTCQLPTTDAGVLGAQLDAMTRAAPNPAHRHPGLTARPGPRGADA